METTTGKISVEEFKLWLTKLKITKDLFRWDLSTEDAYNMLCAAYQKEVEIRGMTCDKVDKVYGYLRSIAETMTTKSTKCGILLCGNCGNGKTTTLHAFYTMCKYMDGMERVKIAEQRMIPKARQLFSTSARRLVQIAKDVNAMNDAKTADVLCIDDMGLEPTEVLDFGNAINPVIEILEHRYRQQLFTFITTNLTPKQIREKYGDRIADRFNEIMKCIVYENPTFRR